MTTRTLRAWWAAWTLAVGATVAGAAEVRIVADQPYKSGPGLTADEQARCRLELYLPPEGKQFRSLLWFHGGGMTGGDRKSRATRALAEHLARRGIAVASADYRLNPAAKFPAYVEDAAAAFAWLKQHVGEYGGDPAQCFIGGHSAGAYLVLMIGLDDRYLGAVGLKPEAIAGVVALSGQTTTHFTVREERQLGEHLVIDDAAPLYHVAKRPFPILLLYAGHDMALRVEENRLLAAALRNAGSPGVSDEFFPDRTHDTILTHMGEDTDAVAARVIGFVLGEHEVTMK